MFPASEWSFQSLFHQAHYWMPKWCCIQSYVPVLLRNPSIALVVIEYSQGYLASLKALHTLVPIYMYARIFNIYFTYLIMSMQQTNLGCCIMDQMVESYIQFLQIMYAFIWKFCDGTFFSFLSSSVKWYRNK